MEIINHGGPQRNIEPDCPTAYSGQILFLPDLAQSFSLPHSAFWVVTYFLFPWIDMESSFLLVSVGSCFVCLFSSRYSKRIYNDWKFSMADSVAVRGGASGYMHYLKVFSVTS